MTSRLTWDNLDAASLAADAALQSAWNRLNAARGGLPFHDAAAANAALEVFGTRRERLLIGREQGEIAAMVLAAPAARFTWQTFQPSQIPLGFWVAEPGLRLGEIAERLVRAQSGLCLALSMTQIDPRYAPREEDSATLRSSDYIETGWIDIAGSFEAYWDARGKNLRQNLRKQRRKFETDGITGRLVTLTAAADMGPALERYGQIESAGWKGAGGTAIHLDNDQGRFYLRLLQDAAARGEAVVYEYHFNDRPVAINLCLVRQGTLIILKTTYDESTQPYSPAQLLLQDLLEELHRGTTTTRVEFYGRMMEWHTRWTESKRTLYHLTCFRHALVKQLAALRQRRAAA